MSHKEITSINSHMYRLLVDYKVVNGTAVIKQLNG